jgi:membrane-bound ClpP family serine protease
MGALRLRHRAPAFSPPPHEEKLMSLGTILLLVLILMLIGVVPTWPHSRSWGYAPSGVLGIVVLLLLVLLLLGRI